MPAAAAALERRAAATGCFITLDHRRFSRAEMRDCGGGSEQRRLKYGLGRGVASTQETSLDSFKSRTCSMVDLRVAPSPPPLSFKRVLADEKIDQPLLRLSLRHAVRGAAAVDVEVTGQSSVDDAPAKSEP